MATPITEIVIRLEPREPDESGFRYGLEEGGPFVAVWSGWAVTIYDTAGHRVGHGSVDLVHTKDGT